MDNCKAKLCVLRRDYEVIHMHENWAFAYLLILYTVFGFGATWHTIECFDLIILCIHSKVNCYLWPNLGNRSKSHIRQNQTNTTSISSHITVILVSSLNLSLPTWGWLQQGWIHGDVKGSNGSFRHWQVSGLGTSSIAAWLSSPSQTSTV